MTRTRTARRLVKTVATLACLGAWAAPGAASSTYPAVLQDATGSPCPPPCTICHLTMNGGSGSALKPFAESMIDIGGLEGEEQTLVAPAVEALKAAKTDSDGDGTPDITELANGHDPNRSGDGDLCGPTYGCGARIEPDGRIDFHALGAALGAILVLVARWRKRRGPAIAP